MADMTTPEISEMPDDWWQTHAGIEALLKWLRHHIISWFIAGRDASKSQHDLYSGFLVSHRDRLLWLTAGHVIDKISVILSSPNFTVTQMRWLDNYEINSVPGGPVHYRHPRMKSWQDEGFDFGVTVIGDLDVASIMANPKVLTFKLQPESVPEQIAPEAYIAVGFPQERRQTSEVRVSSVQVRHNLAAPLVGLPLRRVERPTDSAGDDFWEDPEAFYGEILPYTDRKDLKIGNIKGMSDGPIVSITRVDGRLWARVIGVQHSWRPSLRIIRAEPSQRVIELLDAWL